LLPPGSLVNAADHPDVDAEMPPKQAFAGLLWARLLTVVVSSATWRNVLVAG